MKAKILKLILTLVAISGAVWAEEKPSPTFSGQTQVYEDTFNGYRLKIPVEFQNTGKGASTMWEGPKVDNFTTGIFVNCTPMPGVHPQAIYDGVIRSKKSDRNVTEVVPVKMAGKLKGKPIFAFRCKETGLQPGTPNAKQAEDHHRWYLYVYGNDSCYELAVTSSFQALGQGKELPPVFDAVIKSFSLIQTR